MNTTTATMYNHSVTNIIRHPNNKKYSINSVLNKISVDKERVNFDGELVKMDSDRYKTFFHKGTTCTMCGVEGSYFYLERFPENSTYHFNLYAEVGGKEILMSKDHIVPKSKGGKDHLDNYTTMCCICNAMKADMPEEKAKEQFNFVNSLRNKAQHLTAEQLIQIEALLPAFKYSNAQILYTYPRKKYAYKGHGKNRREALVELLIVLMNNGRIKREQLTSILSSLIEWKGGE